MAQVIKVDAVVDVKEGDLRVWWIRNPPNPAWFHIVANIAQARQLLDSLAKTDLRDNRIESNAGGLEVYRDGEWEEWYDEKGDSIDDMEEMTA